MMVTLARGSTQGAPGCFILVPEGVDPGNEKGTRLFQTDWDFPPLARNFGYTGPDERPSEAIYDYLDECCDNGKTIEDPGYFNVET